MTKHRGLDAGQHPEEFRLPERKSKELEHFPCKPVSLQVMAYGIRGDGLLEFEALEFKV